MKMTNKDVLNLEKFAKKNKKSLTHITDKSKLTTEDKFKLGLCKHFVQFAISKNLKAADMADIIKIPASRMSEITNYKIDKFTVDKLLNHLSSLAEHDNQINEYLTFLNQAVDMPLPKIATSRRLSKELREASLSI